MVYDKDRRTGNKRKLNHNYKNDMFIVEEVLGENAYKVRNERTGEVIIRNKKFLKDAYGLRDIDEYEFIKNFNMLGQRQKVNTLIQSQLDEERDILEESGNIRRMHEYIFEKRREEQDGASELGNSELALSDNRSLTREPFSEDELELKGLREKDLIELKRDNTQELRDNNIRRAFGDIILDNKSQALGDKALSEQALPQPTQTQALSTIAS